MIHRSLVIARAAGAGLLALVILGCGGDAVDLDKAKTAVTTSLSKWKDKGTPQQLEGIDIADPDWSGGYQLLDFRIKDAAAQPQQGPRVVVVLNLKDRRGKKMDKEVAYEVIIGDKIKIGRDAFHVGS